MHHHPNAKNVLYCCQKKCCAYLVDNQKDWVLAILTEQMTEKEDEKTVHQANGNDDQDVLVSLMMQLIQKRYVDALLIQA